MHIQLAALSTRVMAKDFLNLLKALVADAKSIQSVFMFTHARSNIFIQFPPPMLNIRIMDVKTTT